MLVLILLTNIFIMGKIKPLDEALYKPDFEIRNSYIDFSSELLRLSLIAMGGFGALVLAKIENGQNNINDLLNDSGFFLASMILFTICVASTLFHRYYASDCMSWYISWLRAEENGDTRKAEIQYTGYHKMLKRSTRSLILAEFFFGGGVLFFIIGIIKILKP